MNTVLTVLITNYTRLFEDSPRGAFLLRTSNKSVRAAFDKFVSPTMWWLWIQNFFMPSLTGLPLDLKAEFYISLLRKYFAPINDLEKIRCVFQWKIGVLLDRRMDDDDKVFRLLTEYQILSRSAQGRAFMIRLVKEWLVAIQNTDDMLDGTALEIFLSYFLYSMQLKSHMEIEAGYNRSYDNTIERDLLVRLFDTWRQ
jgi:hypothetical protein